MSRFKESLTGTEYAARFIQGVRERKITLLTEASVLSLTKEEKLTIINSVDGISKRE